MHFSGVVTNPLLACPLIRLEGAPTLQGLNNDPEGDWVIIALETYLSLGWLEVSDEL